MVAAPFTFLGGPNRRVTSTKEFGNDWTAPIPCRYDLPPLPNVARTASASSVTVGRDAEAGWRDVEPQAQGMRDFLRWTHPAAMGEATRAIDLARKTIVPGDRLFGNRTRALTQDVDVYERRSPRRVEQTFTATMGQTRLQDKSATVSPRGRRRMVAQGVAFFRGEAVEVAMKSTVNTTRDVFAAHAPTQIEGTRGASIRRLHRPGGVVEQVAGCDGMVLIRNAYDHRSIVEPAGPNS